MPLDIKAAVIEKSTARVDVKLEAYGQSIWVEYMPAAYDWEIERTLVNDSERLPAGTIKDFILKFVVDWDLQYDGEKIPITPDGLKLVDFMTIQAPIANSIMLDMQEGKSLRTVSQPRSSTAPAPQQRSKAKARLQAVQ